MHDAVPVHHILFCHFEILSYTLDIALVHCCFEIGLGWARGRLVALDAPLRARLGDTNSLDQDIF